MSVSFENTATNRGVVTFTIGQDKICLLYTSDAADEL